VGEHVVRFTVPVGVIAVIWMQANDPVGPLPIGDVSTNEISSTPASAEYTAKKQRGRPFEPDNSGNPHGRRKGSNKTTLRSRLCSIV
jgi:hypothetical protein